MSIEAEHEQLVAAKQVWKTGPIVKAVDVVLRI